MPPVKVRPVVVDIWSVPEATRSLTGMGSEPVPEIWRSLMGMAVLVAPVKDAVLLRVYAADTVEVVSIVMVRRVMMERRYLSIT